MKRDFAALLAFVDERQTTPHAWGRRANDCVSFAAYAVKALTGHHWLGKLTWCCERTALRAIAREGGIEAAIDKRYERIPPSMAQRGDIAGVPDERFGIHPMIVEGETLVCPGPNGNERCPRGRMVCAWSATKPKRPKRKAKAA